jgi:hypothetical protein
VTEDGPVRVSGEVPWRRRPALYREHAVCVTASPAQAQAQRACGARAVIADGDRTGFRRRIAEATAAGPPDWPEIISGLRDLYDAHATAARLRALAALVHHPDGMIAGRQLAVLARATNAEAAHALGASLLGQRLLPAELIVSAGPDPLADRAVAGLLSDLAGHGVRVEVISQPDEVPAPAGAWIRACAARARSPWAAPWHAGQDHSATYLLDLACARECSQADAVGYAGPRYEYTAFLESPGLARRELLGAAPPGQPSLDVSNGLRLFSVS